MVQSSEQRLFQGATSGSKATNKTVNPAKSPTPTNLKKQQAPSLAKKVASVITGQPAKSKEQGCREQMGNGW
ncbi:hypothetical protein [Solibacillus ferritrahens]|uniref:hypothetical protein n=1 Tax=Solibacillus ferritrahens TaxID=3098620 RepID=UPI0030089420